MRQPLLPVAVLILALTPLAVGEEGVRAFEEYEKAVKAALDAKDDDVRARAFEVLHECRDARAVELIVSSVKAIHRDQERIRRDQQKIEEDYEAQFTKKVKADQWFENSPRSGKDLDRYNKAVRKIRKKLDQLRLKQRNLENDFTRTRALLDAGVRAMSKVLENLPAPDLGPALVLLEQQWRDGRSPEDKMRWLDAISGVERPTIAERIRATVDSLAVPVQVRAAALQTLGARRDLRAFDMALDHLRPEGSSWDMTAAAIAVLRLLHEKRSIEPLITFLARDDIKRLREDAHRALVSLTGEKHGPHAEPWQRWWEDRGDAFQVPPKPVDPSRGPEAAAGTTFYGIPTFSDRVLFIIDVSGSMDQAPKPGPEEGPKPPKIAVARRELVTFIDNLNDTDRFNVIFFNHEVVRWQPKMVEAADTNRRRAKKWITDQEPQGGTNIHDALEAGFALALRATGEPILDTIFFLTDGRPTAGKLQEPEEILAQVEEWNRTARVTIHCVGVGDHDQEFMQALANIGGGEYRKK